MPDLMEFHLYLLLHTPHDGATEEDKGQWWDILRSQVQKFATAGHLIILGDFNARIGRSIPGCVGELVCEQTTDNGERFLELLEAGLLWIPASYSDIHTGHSWTWTHPRGTHARLDYVIFGQSSTLWATGTKVDTTIQTSLTVRDHENHYIPYTVNQVL